MQSNNSTEHLLTDLCAICHVNPLKYTCPRCGIHTCSLPCVKRHKVWGQCSGIRDPAEYRKRSELATPSSIDKDFNFITKVERTLQKADDSITDKGIDLVPARLRWQDNKSKVEQEAEVRDIKIIKAPTALSRSKQNKTHWAGNAKCVMWTMEWICYEGEKRISNTHETKTIVEAYNNVFGKKSHGTKRKRPREGEGAGRDAQSMAPTAQISSKQLSGQIPGASSTKPDDKIAEGSLSNDDIKPEQLEQSELSPVEVENETRENYESNNVQHGTNDTVTTTTATPVGTKKNQLNANLHFYLHRPSTEARYKCLIPISQDVTLQEVLNQKTLLEFPTIYVRTEAPEQLQEPFISESEYLKRYGADIPINISTTLEMVTEDDAGKVTEHAPSGADMVPELNKMKVLEVLAKDLGAD